MTFRIRGYHFETIKYPMDIHILYLAWTKGKEKKIGIIAPRQIFINPEINLD
jgi:hypothetical protein